MVHAKYTINSYPKGNSLEKPSLKSSKPKQIRKNVNQTCQRVPQYLTTAAVSLGGFSLGNVLGWSSPALSSIASSGDFPELETSHLAWIGSLVTIGAAFGGLCSGCSIQMIGRKKTLLAIGIPFLAGWLSIALAQQIYLIYVGRFLTGFSVGALALAGSVYLIEISETEIRGLLGAIFQVSVNIGIVFTFILGSMASWKVLAAECGVFPILFIITTSFIPESPRYLIAKNRSSEAIKVLSWLRSSDPANPSKRVLEELKEIEGAIEQAKERQLSHLDLITLPVLKPMLITLGLIFFNQFCGFNAVGFYTVTIFEEAALGFNPHLSSIVVGIVQIFSASLASVFIDKAPRRVILVFAFGTMCMSLMTLGTFFHMKNLQSKDIFAETTHWIPLACVIVFNAAYCGGVGSLVWTIVSEILPNHVIGFASGLAATFNWTLAFTVTRFFHDLNSCLGIHNTFWLFSIACAIAILFVYAVVPETQGKTLDMIQQENFRPKDPNCTDDITSVVNSCKDLV